MARNRGVETCIPGDRRIDGIAEVTFQPVLLPLQAGRTALAHKDEVNVSRRTFLYAGAPNSSRWYDAAALAETVGSRVIIYLRGRDGVRGRAPQVRHNQLVPALAGTGALKELRAQTFLPWSEMLWDTPNVSHDNPDSQHFHARSSSDSPTPRPATPF